MASADSTAAAGGVEEGDDDETVREEILKTTMDFLAAVRAKLRLEELAENKAYESEAQQLQKSRKVQDRLLQASMQSL